MTRDTLGHSIGIETDSFTTERQIMRTKTIRSWTYEEVRAALQKVYGPITGIKMDSDCGYIVEECLAAEQPQSAPEPKEEEPIP